MTVPLLTGTRVRARRGGTAWQVTVDRLQDLARLAPSCVGAARISDLDLRVERWWPPQEGWLGSPGLSGLVRVEIEPVESRVRVHLSHANEVDAGVLLAAALRCLRPHPTGVVGPLLTFAPGVGADAAPLADRIRDVLGPLEERDAHVRRCDTLVIGADDPGTERRHFVTVGASTWLRDGERHPVHVDPAVHRPIGRRSTGGIVVRGKVTDEALTVTLPDGVLTVAGDLTAQNVRTLRTVRALVVDRRPSERMAAQLAACGLLVASTVDDLPHEADDLAWQAASVRGRRHVLRTFGPRRVLGDWPSVSVLLVTNRPRHVERALAQVARLRYPSLQVVIGTHGEVDGAELSRLAKHVPHPVVVVPVPAELNLGEALQRASARAEGDLLTKMDDDDVYGPEHVWDLVLAREYSGAQVVGKALDWIHLESEDATVFRPTYAAERYADFVAGGTILLSAADLLAVGGWRPVPRSVDRALLDRVLAAGGLVYRTHGLGYVYARHSAGHTASVSDEHFLTRTAGRFNGLVRHEAFGTVDGAGS